MKVTALEEVHDLKTLRFDELMGSLMAFELSLPKVKKKHKDVAFKSSTHGQKEQITGRMCHKMSKTTLSKDLTRMETLIEETEVVSAVEREKVLNVRSVKALGIFRKVVQIS